MSSSPRTQRGSALALLMAVAGVLLIFALASISIAGVFVLHQKLQNESERIALDMVRTLNDEDSLGHLNYLAYYSHEALFAAANNAKQCSKDQPELARLAHKLTVETEEGSRIVEGYGREYDAFVRHRIEEQLAQILREQKRTGSLKALGAIASPLAIAKVELGARRDLLSNVQPCSGMKELVRLDRQRQMIDPATNLYLPNRLLEMGGTCAELKLSPVAPNVGIITLPHLINGQNFEVATKFVRRKDHWTAESFGRCSPCDLRITASVEYTSAYQTSAPATLALAAASTTRGSGARP